jgi:hypothetical protein
MELFDPKTAALIQAMEQKIALLSSIANQIEQPNSAPSQQLGKLIPSIEGVEIQIPGMEHAPTDDQRYIGNIQIAADGAFQARAIHFCTRSEAPVPGAIGDVFDWFPAGGYYWEYSVTGSNRNRQNIPVPSWLPMRNARMQTFYPWADLRNSGGGFFSLPVEDVFPATSKVTVTLTLPPGSVAQAFPGIKIYVGFSGAYILK